MYILFMYNAPTIIINNSNIFGIHRSSARQLLVSDVTCCREIPGRGARPAFLVPWYKSGCCASGIQS